MNSKNIRIKTPKRLADSLRGMRPNVDGFAIVIQPLFSCDVDGPKEDTLACVVFDPEEAKKIKRLFYEILEERKAKVKA